MVVWVLAVAALVFPAAASRADDAPTLSVQLTDLQATGTTPDSVVIVSGTVRNDGTVTARQASVSLWRSTARLRSAAVVTEALARSESPRGSIVSGEPGQRVDVIRPGGALAPQESRSFTLRSTLRGLELTALDASYWIGVDASASAAASGPVITAGSTRSLLTLPERPVGVGSVILLTSRPRQIRENLFTDDTLVTELQSRLAPLVEAARTGEIEWAVDPSLYAEVSDMADGYRVVAGASTAQGPGSDVARQWLDAVDALPRSTGRQLLYGTPDLSGAARVGDPAVLDRALAAGKADPVPGLSTVVWTPHLDPATVTLAARADTPLLTTGTGVESPAAAHDGRLVLRATPLAGLTGQALPDGRVNRASALAALARVAGGQVRFVTTPGELATDRYARYAWMSTASAFQPSGTLPAYEPPESVEGQSVVTPTLARTLDALASDLVAYGDAAPTSGMAALADATASRGASLAWLRNTGDHTVWLDAVRSRFGARAVAAGIVLDAAPRLTMSSDTADFPVTVTNSLSDPVTVVLVSDSENSARLRVEPSQPLTIRPNASETVTLRASAAANGVVTARIHAQTENRRRLSPDVLITVEATSLGMLGWILVVVSGVVLVVSTAWRIRKVRAQQSNKRGGND